MSATTQDLPPIKACLFDMDGLLLNTEDIYTDVTNRILKGCGRPNMPWNIKAMLQGRPAPEATHIFLEWAQLPISQSEYDSQRTALQTQLFPTCAPLPGVVELLKTLSTAEGIELALATSSRSDKFALKTSHLTELLEVFPKQQQILGDDERIPKGRGKPAPDIYLLALQSINVRRKSEGKEAIKPEECLVFEDAVLGVEAGRRAGMRVVWVPHEGLREEFRGQEEGVLAGRMGTFDDSVPRDWGRVGQLGDGLGEVRETLEGFDYKRYGIVTK